MSSPSTVRSQTTRSNPQQATAVNANGEVEPIRDAVDYVKAYARERPDVAALWCLGIGFILGWKLKPW